MGAARKLVGRGRTPRAPTMNRRYAYLDHAILVTALPAGDRPGWRPEICVISPDEEWQLVPTPASLVAGDVAKCIEIGRRCGETVIEALVPASAAALRTEPLH
jgi:hypothetical protein